DRGGVCARGRRPALDLAPRSTTARRSSGSATAGWPLTSPAPTSSTASACAGKAAARMAREQLRTAHELLSDIGAEAFAERAARELRATGEHPRQRTAQPTDTLTAQELHIARLVAAGATSREVGAQLFLSPRTIEAHLRNIFRKLDITSRRQLRELRLP